MRLGGYSSCLRFSAIAILLMERARKFPQAELLYAPYKTILGFRAGPVSTQIE